MAAGSVRRPRFGQAIPPIYEVQAPPATNARLRHLARGYGPAEAPSVLLLRYEGFTAAGHRRCHALEHRLLRPLDARPGADSTLDSH